MPTVFESVPPRYHSVVLSTRHHVRHGHSLHDTVAHEVCPPTRAHGCETKLESVIYKQRDCDPRYNLFVLSFKGSIESRGIALGCVKRNT